jgi:hypothetical protein
MKKKWVLAISLSLVALLVLPLAACPSTPTTTPPTTTAPTTTAPTTTAPPEPVTLYIGGAFANTSPYAEDSLAVMYGYQDYAEWINENHMVAPWYPEKTIPENISFEVLWQDDQYQASNVLPIYESLMAKGMLLYRNSGTSPEILAPQLMEDRVGAVSMSCEAFLLSPPKTIFTQFVTFVDCLAADAEWFMDQWTEDRAPRYAFLTADNEAGRSVIIPELSGFMEDLGYEFVGSAFVPFVITTPPTTQLLWLKENEVDLTIGFCIRAATEPLQREAVRLGMGWGPEYDYQICFGWNYPSSISPYSADLGELGNGVISGGNLPDWDYQNEGCIWVKECLQKYRPDLYADYHAFSHGYHHGYIEAMIQVEALRLAIENSGKSIDELTPNDVLENGFWNIKDFDMKGMRPTTLTYSETEVWGLSGVNVTQCQNGKPVEVGVYPYHLLLPGTGKGLNPLVP